MCRFQRFHSATQHIAISDQWYTFSNFISLWKGVCLMTFVIYFALFPMCARCRISRFLWKCGRHLNRRTNQGKNKHWIVCCCCWCCCCVTKHKSKRFVWCSNELLLFFLFYSLANLIVSVPDASIFVTGASINARIHGLCTSFVAVAVAVVVAVKLVIIYEQIACNSPITSRKEWNQQHGHQ